MSTVSATAYKFHSKVSLQLLWCHFLHYTWTVQFLCSKVITAIFRNYFQFSAAMFQFLNCLVIKSFTIFSVLIPAGFPSFFFVTTYFIFVMAQVVNVSLFYQFHWVILFHFFVRSVRHICYIFYPTTQVNQIWVWTQKKKKNVIVCV